MINVARTFCDVIYKAGYNIRVYASTSWLEENLYAREINDYDFWVADLSYPRFRYIGNYEVATESLYVIDKPNGEKIDIIEEGKKYTLSDNINGWAEFKFGEGYTAFDCLYKIE